MTTQGTPSPSDKDLMTTEYGILVDLIKHQHARVQDFNKTFLTSNTILIGACTILLKDGVGPLHLLLVPLCILGISASIVWMCVQQRLNVDSDLRWFQLRNIERALSRPKGIFCGGVEFFQKGKLEAPGAVEPPVVFPEGLIGLLARFRVVWVGLVLPLLFVVFYIVLLFISYSIGSP